MYVFVGYPLGEITSRTSHPIPYFLQTFPPPKRIMHKRRSSSIAYT